jgi:hypothetical protein
MKILRDQSEQRYLFYPVLARAEQVALSKSAAFGSYKVKRLCRIFMRVFYRIFVKDVFFAEETYSGKAFEVLEHNQTLNPGM